MSELWVDTDLGFDDMHAVLLLRSHGIKPVGCSLVFGCATLDQVHANAGGFEQAFDFNSVWHRGAASALDGQCRTAEHVLGPSGMHSRGQTLDNSKPMASTTTALEAMVHWLISDPDSPEVLALGPLTNLARLMEEAPQLARKIQRITWMGGSEGRGNQTEYAEFNAWADAAAADIVMTSDIPVRIVELEACRQVQLVAEDLKQLSAIETDTALLLHDLLGGYLDIGISRGRSGMAVYDPLAAAAVILNETNPTMTSVPVIISVDTSAERSGQTHIERVNDTHLTKHSMVQVTDSTAARSLVLDALVECARSNCAKHSH